MNIIPFGLEYKYILPPIAGAIIGWFTNYIAIKLLFRPHHPKNILGFKIQGLIPKRKQEIALSIARTIERELLSSRDLAHTLNSIDWKGEIERIVEEIIDHRFGSGKMKGIPVIGLVSENLKYHIKYFITREVLRQMEVKRDAFLHNITRKIDLQDMLATRIDCLDLERFEGLLTGFIARELRHIEWLGGIMGFLIGLVQSGVFYFYY